MNLRLRAAMLAATVLGGAAMSPGLATAANLLTNGSFEGPNIGTGNYTYAAHAAAGWTFSGAALVNASGSNAWYGATPPSGMDGVQFASLQGLGSMTQSFTANASTLHLGWLSAGRPNYGCCNGDQSYDITLDGSAVGGVQSTVSGTNFSFNSLDLTGLTAGTSYTLGFKGLVSADESAFIDGVVLSNTAVAAPAAPPTKTISGSDLPLPAGQSIIDDFDNPIAAGFSFSGGYVRSGALGLDPSVSAPPPGDLTNYETVLGGESATLTSIKLLKSFSFYLGSPDAYNSIRFLGPSYDFTLNGSAIWLPASGGGTGDQSWGRRVSYDFGGYGVNKIIFSSASNSFEFDNLAGSAAPEPAAWALLLTGFFSVGALLRARRRLPIRL